MARAVTRAKVVEVAADGDPAPITVGDGHDHVVLIVTLAGAVVGPVAIAAGDAVSPERQRAAIEAELGSELCRLRLAADFRRATRGGVRVASTAPQTSVIVLSHRGGEALEATLASIDALRTPPAETVVVQPEPGDLARTLERALAASNEILALTDDGCTVHPGWLDGLADAFRDPLVAVVGGALTPREIETRAQCALALRDMRGSESARVLAGLERGNAFLRRAALDELGVPGTARLLLRRASVAGYRARFDAARRVTRAYPRRAGAAAARVRTRLRRDRPTQRTSATPAGAGAGSAPRVKLDADASVSVAIASHNRRARLEQVLRGLAEQRYPRERFDVTVVLDGSTDGSAELVRGLDTPYGLELVEQENRGVGAARNVGLRAARSPLVVFLDDDVVPEPQLIAEHVAAHAAAPDAHVVMGPYPPASVGTGMFSVGVRQWWSDHFRRKAEPDHQWTFIDFGNGNISSPRALLLDHGGWDEEFRVRHEDWELGIRLLEAGVRLAYRPGAGALHYFDPAFSTALRNRRIEGRSDVELARKHPRVRRRLGFAELVPAGERLRWRRRLLLGRPAVAGRLARSALPAATALERLGLREGWAKLVSRLLSQAYMQGVAEAASSPEELRWLLEPDQSETVCPLEVRLDRAGTLEIPDAVRQIELAVGYGDERVAGIPAIAPEAQWDWDELTQRVVDAAAEPLARAAMCGQADSSQPGRN